MDRGELDAGRGSCQGSRIMKKFMVGLVALGWGIVAAGWAASDDLVPAQECRPRGGWPHFFALTSTPRAEVRVAYLGGSITAQAGWRVKSLAHLRATYPDVRFNEINAAIGGTGSDLGVFRLQQDVLVHRPDLVFVEFAVNDGGASPQQIVRCMEGIVRQIRRQLPACDIGFVYTLTETLAPAMLEGKFQRSASAMEQVADHYGLPSVHLAMEVAQLAAKGRLVWKGPLPKTAEERKALGDAVVFAPDGVHPHPETGHVLYTEALVRSLEPIRQASQAPRDHTLPAPLDPLNYERARMIPIGAARLSAGFVKPDPAVDPFAKTWVSRLTDLRRATTPGETLTFRFKGTRCAIFDVIGPDSGQVRVTLDERPPETKSRFDSFCTYHRLNTFLVGTDLSDTVHTVTIELLPEAPDKTAILAQRKQTMDDPARYGPLTFNPGAILVVGEVLAP